MIKYFVKRSDTELVTELSRPPQGEAWVVASRVSKDELHHLASRYQLDQSILSDALDHHELPRIEFSKYDTYVFFRIPHLVKHGEVVSAPLLAVIAERVFVTATIGTIEPPLELLDGKSLDMNSAGPLLLTTLAAAVSEYEHLIIKTARFIRETGHRLRSHEATNRDFIYFVTVEDNLNLFQRDLSGMLAVTDRLKTDLRHKLSNSDLDSLDDISLHVNQLLVSISSYAHSIESIRNAYSTVANNILNQRMKILTTLTLLVALPNVFYGMYGMNVALPFADEPWVFGGIVIFTALLILLLLTIVRRSKIL